MKIRPKALVFAAILALLASHITVSTMRYDADRTALASSFDLIPSAFGQQFRDPCANPSIVHTTAALAATADQTTITGTAGRLINICGMDFTLTGAAPTVRFQSGTGTTCQTATVQLTGVMATGTGLVMQVTMPPGRTIMQTDTTGANFCIDLPATGGPSLQGWINYLFVRP